MVLLGEDEYNPHYTRRDKIISKTMYIFMLKKMMLKSKTILKNKYEVIYSREIHFLSI